MKSTPAFRDLKGFDMKTKPVLTADDAALISAACQAEAVRNGWR